MRAALAGVLLASAAAPTQVFTWRDERIDESSGLVDRGSTTVTTNDSGDAARLFVVNRRGETVRTVDYDASVRDVEALAPAGGGRVWVGDVGDNDRERDDLALHRVRLADGATETFPVAYADGRSYDAESLLALPGGRLAVVTKSLAGQVWFAPRSLRTDRVNLLRPGPRVAGLATDAAYDPTSGLAVVRGYGGATVYDARTWDQVGTVPLPEQAQGEGISVGPGGRVRVSSEGAGTPVWQLAGPLSSYAASPSPSPSPDPAASPASASAPAGPAWLVPGAAGVVVVGVGLLVCGRRRRR